MLRLQPVAGSAVEHGWSFAAPYIERSLARDHGQGSLYEVQQRVFAGHATVWLLYDDESKTLVGAVLTVLYQYPRKMILQVEHFACDAPREQWAPLFDTLTQYAYSVGCSEIEMTGRRGWMKVLPQLGFQETFVTMARPV